MDPYRKARLRNEVWEGSIPALFQLCAHDVAASTSPLPQLVMIPRCSYVPLALLTSTAWNYFKEFMVQKPSQKDQFWIEDEQKQVPVRWQYPAGVVYDIHQLSLQHRDSPEGETTVAATASETNKSLATHTQLPTEYEANEGHIVVAPGVGSAANQLVPWRLVIHVGEPPTDTIPPCTEDDDVKWRFNQSLKQAVYLQQDTVQPVMTMQKSKHERLWYCLTKGDFEGTCTSSPLLEEVANHEKPGKELVFPLRILYQDRPCKQIRGTISDADGIELTVGKVLEASGYTYERILCHGINVPPSAPVSEVYKTMRHPDGFLYVCVG
eukprot:gb/GECG01002610.1/.p1 GENE.gb/GECG01002610.1/~~gb/GECG01002610.1/.p1  ORF type:complete len:324 (+),score=32.92 gb/GECG01002610.1/:1-972(+)